MKTLIDALVDAGFSVQCRHDATERTRQDHGDVTLTAADGSVVATCAKFQHNQNYHDRHELADEIITQVEGKHAKLKVKA